MTSTQITTWPVNESNVPNLLPHISNLITTPCPPFPTVAIFFLIKHSLTPPLTYTGSVVII